MKAESGLRGRIRQALRQEFGKHHAKIVGQPANAMTGPGRSDLYVLVFGVHVDLEIKTATGKATDIQLENVRTTRAAGGYAWIVRTPAAAVGAVWAAVRGEPMTGEFNFDDLFSEPSEEGPPVHLTGDPSDIHAFLQEPEIQAAVERNGTAPAGDGAAIEPADDYGEHRLLNALSRLELKLDRMTGMVGRLFEILEPNVKGWTEQPGESAATSAEIAALLEGPVDPPPAAPAPPPTKRVRKR